jgi:hypothetical protein
VVEPELLSSNPPKQIVPWKRPNAMMIYNHSATDLDYKFLLLYIILYSSLNYFMISILNLPNKVIKSCGKRISYTSYMSYKQL